MKKLKTFKRILSFAVLLAMLLPNLAYAANGENALMLFVSTTGKEGATGTIDDPFATFEQARDAIRAMKAAGEYPEDGVVVNFREGVYNIQNTIELTNGDSGKVGAPVVYRGYLNEKVVFTYAINITKPLTEVTDETVKKMLEPSVADKIKQVDLSEVAEFVPVVRKGNAGTKRNDLIINGEVIDMARYPDGNEYIRCTYPSWPLPEDEPIQRAVGGPDIFVGGNIQNQYEYEWEHAELTDTTVTILGSSLNVIIANPQCAYFNSPAFISLPGECYIDREKKVAYVYPREGEVNTIEVSGGKGAMISLNNADRISFRNIHFTGGVGDCFNIAGDAEVVDGLVIDNCVIENFNNNGIGTSTSLTNNSVIKNTRIYNVGIRGVSVRTGAADPYTDGNFEMFNCDVEKTGRVYPYQSSAIWFNGKSVGGDVRYCEIQKIPTHTIGGTTIAGIIEHNDIHNTNMTGEDQAIIYWGYNFMSLPGMTVRHNYLHDNLETVHVTGHGSHGLYIDGGGANQIYGNVLAEVADRGVSGEGVIDHIYNNIFIGRKDGKSKSVLAIHRGVKGSSSAVGGKQIDATLEQLVNSSTAQFKTSRLEDPGYIKNFPEWVAQLKTGRPYWGPQYIYNNLIYNYGGIELGKDSAGHPNNRLENNYSTDADPGFVDPENGNYALKADSVVFQKIPGFRNVDMSRMGLGSNIVKNTMKGAIALRINSPLAYKDRPG